MSDLLKLDIPERTLRLLKGWTIENLANAEILALGKIKGIGVKTAQLVIKSANQQMEKDQEERWKKEKQYLRERIKAEEYLFNLQQAKMTMQQEQSGVVSARIKRIKKANA